MTNRITAVFKDKKNSKSREYTFRSTNSISSYLKVSSSDYLNLTTQMTIGTKIEARFKFGSRTYRPIQTITTSVSTSISAGISGRSTYNFIN